MRHHAKLVPCARPHDAAVLHRKGIAEERQIMHCVRMCTSRAKRLPERPLCTTRRTKIAPEGGGFGIGLLESLASLGGLRWCRKLAWNLTLD